MTSSKLIDTEAGDLNLKQLAYEDETQYFRLLWDLLERKLTSLVIFEFFKILDPHIFSS